MAINLSDNILSKTTSPVDAKYGPYFGTTIQDAITSALTYLIDSYRYEGLCVGLKAGADDIVEYWFVGGTADNNFIIKTAGSNYSGETGTSIVNKLQALPLNEKLTASDITYNSEILKTFLDTLSGNVNGNFKFGATYGGSYIPNIIIQFYDENDTIVNTLITTNIELFASVPTGTYKIIILLPIGYEMSTLSVTDINSSNNLVAPENGIVLGVDIDSSQEVVVSSVLVPQIIPELNEIIINGGDQFASNPNLSVFIDSIGLIDQYMIAETPDFLGVSWINYTSNTVQYFKDYISETVATLYVRARNSKGISNTVTGSISMANGLRRSDSSKTYNELKDAIDDIYLDYGGVLTTNVTITCVGNTINKRLSGKYYHTIVDFKSDYFLTIEGANKLTIDCASLGGIKILNSNNILFQNINFVNVGSEFTSSAPEELAAVFVQGLATNICSNIVIRNSIIDCSETIGATTLKGKYALIAKYVDNFSVIGCTITHPKATMIKVTNVFNLSIIKNSFLGSQVTGIVSQPCHISALSCERIEITDNNFNGTTYNTGLIVDANDMKISRNKFYNFRGEALRITSTKYGKLLDISSNQFYNNLLQIPYTWVVYSVIINSDFENVRIVSNTFEMRGINYATYFERLIRAYSCTINYLTFSNNIVYINCPPPRYTNNSSSGSILAFDILNHLESNNNIYLDTTTDGDTLNTTISTIGNSTFSSIKNKKKISELNVFGYEIDSKVLNINDDIFTNIGTHDFHLTSNGNTLTASNSGDIESIDNGYMSGSTNAGAFGYQYVMINENDNNTDYIATNIVSDINYTVNDVINSYSTELVLFKKKNFNRTKVFLWRIVNTGDTSSNYQILGGSGFVSLISNLDIDGKYLSDATYDITVDSTLYDNKAIVTQRKTISKFVSSNYFPQINDTIELTSSSVEAMNYIWTLNNGIVSGTTISGTSQNTVPLLVETTNPIREILTTENNVNSDSSNKWLYPIFPPTRFYSEISVSRECARVGDTIDIIALDYNDVSGETPTYQFTILNSSGDTVMTLNNKVNTGVAFNELGVYDVILEVTTNTSTVKQTLGKLITITPALSDISTAIPCIMIPTTTEFLKQDFGNSSIAPGSTIVLTIPDTNPIDAEYRLSINNLVGTKEQPIVVTVSGSTQLVWNFVSFWGIQFYNCKHVVFDGKGYNDLEYGIHITKLATQDRAIIGLTVGYLCTDIQLFGIEISECTFTALQAKTDPNANNPEVWRGTYTMYNFLLHHCYFHDTTSEGNYIGYFDNGTHTGVNSGGQTVTYRAHALEDTKVYRNKYYRNGWDALQLNNATGNSEICYNEIIDAAIYPEADQATFMSVTLDGSIHDNTMVNSGGVGIQFGAFTNIDVYNNTMTGVAYGYPAFLILSATNVPEQWGVSGNNTTTIINIYNNTTITTGGYINARNVVQFNSVYIKNNLVKYNNGLLFAGQGSSTLDNWIAQSEANYIITDDGHEFEIADVENGNFQISSNSVLTKSGVIFRANHDLRGFDNWYTTSKHAGAYSGYRRLSNSTIVLESFTINNGASGTITKDVTLSYTETGIGTKYMVSEIPTMTDGVWIDITGATINYTLSEPDGLKTVYFRLQNENGMTSGVLSDSISLDRQRHFKIDFGFGGTSLTGPGGYPSTTNEVWNNFYSPVGNVMSGGTTLSGLTDVNGTGSTYYIRLNTNFDVISQGYNIVPTGSTYHRYPVSAMRDSFDSSYPNVVSMSFCNLDPAKTYTIMCFSSRLNRDCRTIYTINGISQPLLLNNNVVNTVDFIGVIPDVNNEITLNYEGTALFADTRGKLSVVEIIENII